MKKILPAILFLLFAAAACGTTQTISIPYGTDISFAQESPAKETVLLTKTTAKTEQEKNEKNNSEKSSDEIIAELFENEESDVQVSGSGVVIKLLADDEDGSRHQRFLLELDTGHTLLIAHNIDIAPRLDGLEKGDEVEFSGEYYYSKQGGGVHWTHHDPDKDHVDGWLKWKDEKYE